MYVSLSDNVCKSVSGDVNYTVQNVIISRRIIAELIRFLTFHQLLGYDSVPTRGVAFWGVAAC